MSLDGITELVGKDCPIMTFAMDSSSSGTVDQLAKLNRQKAGVEDVLNQIKGLIVPEIEIEASKFTSGVPYYKTPDSVPTSSAANYGVTTAINGNVRDWQIEIVSPYNNTSNFIKISGTSFSFDGIGATPIVPSAGALIYCGGDTYTRCLVSTSTASSSAPYTNIVTVSAGSVPDNISSVNYVTSSVLSTSYASGGIHYNSKIDKWMKDYDFGIDHLYHPLGTTGTYGIVAQITSMTAGANVISNNKTKTDGMDGAYRDYSQWVSLVSGSSLEYVRENEFLVSGNMLSSFPVSADLLIDCGSDGSKGCIVSSAQYFEPSGASYTDFTITMVLEPYMASPATSALPTSAFKLNFIDDVDGSVTGIVDRLLSISLSGSESNPITAFKWIDSVTFYTPGDLTSLVPTGSILICDFTPKSEEDEHENYHFTPRYFSVYACEHKSDLRENADGNYLLYADKTSVVLTNGLPITNKLSCVNVVDGG
jgi:hypothetical protein